jgi:hypothetical protein
VALPLFSLNLSRLPLPTYNCVLVDGSLPSLPFLAGLALFISTADYSLGKERPDARFLHVSHTHKASSDQVISFSLLSVVAALPVLRP